jgi:hypothetical protein
VIERLKIASYAFGLSCCCQIEAEMAALVLVRTAARDITICGM